MSRLVLIATAATMACSVVGPRGDVVCTLVGCDSGITVHLATKPTGTVRIEVYAYAPDQQPAYTFNCTQATCPQDVFFPGFVVDHPYVRVTTATGSRLTEITSISYKVLTPNGVNCPPECRQATVTVPLPEGS